MEPLRWNEAKPKDHRTKHENQACLVADKGLDVANYSRASGGGRKMFLTSPLIDQAFALTENRPDLRSRVKTRNFLPIEPGIAAWLSVFVAACVAPHRFFGYRLESLFGIVRH